MRFILFLLLLVQLSAKSQDIRFRNNAAADGRIFSGVILIADSGKVWFEKANGFGDFADSTPLQVNDIFELASVSKQFTAMIIMMLKEKGKLNYDDDIRRYVKIPYKGISIRHLLTHTSGLPDYQNIMDKYWDKTKVAGNKEIIAYLNRYAPPSHFAPGDKYEYSNTGYVLLASIAEKVSGKDFIALCREWIFRPLHMTDTDIRTAAEKKQLQRFAKGHQFVKERKIFLHADSFPSSNYTIWLGNRKGPGRISSTAQDLLKWDQALYNDRLVSAATLTEAFSPMKLNNGTYSNYGFGWDLKTDEKLGRIVSHNGDNPGYKTHIIRCIDVRQTLIVLCNNASEAYDTLVKETLRTVAWLHQQKKQ